MNLDDVVVGDFLCHADGSVIRVKAIRSLIRGIVFDEKKEDRIGVEYEGAYTNRDYITRKANADEIEAWLKRNAHKVVVE